MAHTVCAADQEQIMTTTRKLYQVRIPGVGKYGTTKTLGARYVERARAQRIAKWLKRRGVDAYISAGMVAANCATRKNEPPQAA